MIWHFSLQNRSQSAVTRTKRGGLLFLLTSDDVNLNPPAGLVLPSWQLRRWTPCCPLGWHDLHWCLWADAGSAAGEAREEETGYHGYKIRKGSYHGDTSCGRMKKTKQEKNQNIFIFHAWLWFFIRHVKCQHVTHISILRKVIVKIFIPEHDLLIYLWFSWVEVGLDEDLADANVLAHGPEGGLHGLSCPQDGHTGDLWGRMWWQTPWGHTRLGVNKTL